MVHTVGAAIFGYRSILRKELGPFPGFATVDRRFVDLVIQDKAGTGIFHNLGCQAECGNGQQQKYGFLE